MKTLWMAGCPPNPGVRLLRELTSHSSANVETTIRVDMVDPTSIADTIEDEIANRYKARALADIEGHPEKIHRIDANIDRLEAVQRAIEEEGEEVVRVGVFATIRHEDKSSCESAARKIIHRMGNRRVTMDEVHWKPKESLRTASPVPENALGSGHQIAMTGSSVGTFYPFTSSTMIENSGIIYGCNAVTNEVVKMDRYNRNNGYDIICVGDRGSGKSLGWSLYDLREVINRKDLVSIIVDPRGAFGELCDAFDGDRIVVGGKTKFNPLEITPTPKEKVENVPDLDPYAQRLDSQMDFFRMFITRGDSSEWTSERRVLLREAIDETHRRAGIYPDRLHTHKRPSATVPDLKEVLWEIENDPESFFRREETDESIREWKSAARYLRTSLEPIRRAEYCDDHPEDEDVDPDERHECNECVRGGTYEYLAHPSSFDISESKFVYIDLQQYESSGDIGIMMKLVWDAIYNRGKNSDSKLLTIYDEFHMLLDNESDLEWLGREFRHARHFDNGNTILTQRPEDLFDKHPIARDIANMASMSFAFKCDLSVEHGELLGFNEVETRFVNECDAGDADRGWSHGLLKVGDRSAIPLQVEPMPTEMKYIDRHTWEYKYTDKDVPKPT